MSYNPHDKHPWNKKVVLTKTDQVIYTIGSANATTKKRVFVTDLILKNYNVASAAEVTFHYSSTGTTCYGVPIKDTIPIHYNTPKVYNMISSTGIVRGIRVKSNVVASTEIEINGWIEDTQ